MDFRTTFMNKLRLAAAVGLGLIALAHGQLGEDNENAIGANRNGNGPGFHGLRPVAGLDIRTAIHYRTIHGILAATSIAVLFPVGAILMRIIPGRAAIWIHATFQILATVIFIIAAGFGIFLVKNVNVSHNGVITSIMADPKTSLHPIMGIVTLITLLPQPLFGYLHHRKFKQMQRRNFWTWMHLINGRIAVTVGIANGVMGLNLARAPDRYRKAYIIVAVILWGTWVGTALWSEISRIRANRRMARAVRRRLDQSPKNLKSQPSTESAS